MSEGSRQKRYFTGKPCKYGHGTQRYVSSGKCVVCAKAAAAKWRSDNRERSRETSRQWRQRNPEKHREHVRQTYARHSEYIKAREKKYQQENNEKVNARQRLRREKNIEAEREYERDYRRKNPHKFKEAQRRWYQNNRERVYESVARRHAAKMQRTPAWADREAIRFFYECRPEGCHVDHIVPLQGENVCGLHVEHNLQWLPAWMNWSKNNHYAD